MRHQATTPGTKLRRSRPVPRSKGTTAAGMSCNSGRSRIMATRSRQGRTWLATCRTSSAMTITCWVLSCRSETASRTSCSRKLFPPPKPPPCVRGFKRAAWTAPSRRVGLCPEGTRTGGVSPKPTAVAEAMACTLPLSPSLSIQVNLAGKIVRKHRSMFHIQHEHR